MKMKYTFVLLLTMVSSFSFAQTINFFQVGDTIQSNTNIGDPVDFEGYVENLTSSDILSTWSVTNINFPNQSWYFYVCDKDICSPPGKASKVQDVFANDTSLVKTTIVAADANMGSLTISVANDATGETQSFLLTLDATTSTNALAKVVVFSQNAPNPFDNYTVVKYDLKGNGGFIMVTDIAGRQVNEYNLNATSGEIEIGQDLKAGVYFYSLIVDGRVVMTKRLQKL